MAAKGKDNESNKKTNAAVKSSKKQKTAVTAKKSDAAAKSKKTTSNGQKGKIKAKTEVKSKAAVAAGPKKSPRLLAWEEPEKLILLEGWARDGLSMEQIAHNMGIAKDTLYRWIKLSSYISDALKKGKDVADYLVENALFTSAITGNVVAQIFWLKNRRSDKWADKVEQHYKEEDDDDTGVVILAPRLGEANE